MLNNSALQAKDWLLVADGEPLTKARLAPYLLDHRIMVLDGAYQHACEQKLAIDILLGDFDSIAPTALQQAAASGIQVIHAPNQNYTDVEKGIYHLDRLQAKSIRLCAATGLRLQHTLYNLRGLKKYYRDDCLLQIITPREVIQYAEDTQIIINGKVNENIAILGFPVATVSSEGLQYEMNNCVLEFEKFASISNTLLQTQATLMIQGGALIIREIASVNVSREI